MRVAHVRNGQPPGVRLPECQAGLERFERLLRTSLCQPQPSTCGWNEQGVHAGRQVLMRQERHQRLRFVELSGDDRDIREHRDDERESLAEVPITYDAQRDARGTVSLRQVAKLELQ